MNLPAIPHELKYRLLNWSDRQDAVSAAVEYGVLCARWAREEAAKKCEEQLSDFSSQDVDDFTSEIPWEAESIGGINMARQCAAAIRKE
jgi:hypothetical protein